MDILKISDNSLKLMLTAEDMNTYALNCDSIEHNRSYSVEKVRQILRDAGEICGFKSTGAKFFVQLYTSFNGECEIFVHRIENAQPDYTWDTKEYSIVKQELSKGIYVYSFDDMTPLLETCLRLRTSGYSGDSNAYREYFGRMYYLVLTERSPLPEEQGGKLCTKNTAYYITEHCKLICHDAVDVLAGLA